MTFLEMYNMSRTLLDKSGSPYFTKSAFDIFANIAYNDWIEDACGKFEVDQESKVKLRPLYTEFSKSGSDIIILSTDTPNFRYLTRFNGTFTDECLGVLTRNVRPARNNDIDIMNIDPFQKPIASDPLYIQTEESGVPVFKVFPVPLALSGTYIRNGQIIDSNASPITVFEMPDYIAEEVVERATKKMEINIENYNRVQFEQQEIR